MFVLFNAEYCKVHGIKNIIPFWLIWFLILYDKPRGMIMEIHVSCTELAK